MPRRCKPGCAYCVSPIRRPRHGEEFRAVQDHATDANVGDAPPVEVVTDMECHDLVGIVAFDKREFRIPGDDDADKPIVGKRPQPLRLHDGFGPGVLAASGIEQGFVEDRRIFRQRAPVGTKAAFSTGDARSASKARFARGASRRRFS